MDKDHTLDRPAGDDNVNEDAPSHLAVHEKSSPVERQTESQIGPRNIAQSKGSKEDDIEQETDDTPFKGLGEVEAPPPDENPDENKYYRRGSLERTRSESRKRAQAAPTPRKPGQLLIQLYTYSWLILFSIFGTLARLGTQWITSYPNAPVTPSELWANVGGCLVMGFLMEDRALFRTPLKEGASDAPAALKVDSDSSDADKLNEEVAALQGELEKRRAGKAHLAYKKTLPLYIGLSVGFCGSYTSFSSAMRDAFLALSNDLASKGAGSGTRSDGWSVCAVLAVLISEVGLSLAALSVGAHLCVACAPILKRIPPANSSSILDRLAVFLGFGCWLGAVFLAIWPPQNRWRQDVVFAIVFAPLGCMLRFFLSIKLNSRIARFPLGTFAANMFGSMVLAMCYDLQHAHLASAGGLVGGGLIGCQVLQGVMDGFCGCLTTVSTWVAELEGLRKRHAYEYGFSSVAVGLSFMIVIIGSLHWTIGLSTAACTS